MRFKNKLAGGIFVLNADTTWQTQRIFVVRNRLIQIKKISLIFFPGSRLKVRLNVNGVKILPAHIPGLEEVQYGNYIAGVDKPLDFYTQIDLENGDVLNIEYSADTPGNYRIGIFFELPTESISEGSLISEQMQKLSEEQLRELKELEEVEIEEMKKRAGGLLNVQR